MSEPRGTAEDRRPGRPRSARADDAIRGATLHALLTDGYAGLSIERVAAAAGVAKTTIYRRFAGKAELVADALASVTPPPQAPDTGDFAADVRAALSGEFGGEPAGGPAAALAPLLGEATRDPELSAILKEVLLRPREEAALAAIRRGMERGQLRAELVPEDVLDALVGPLVNRILTSGTDQPDLAGFPERLVDLVMRGAAPR